MLVMYSCTVNILFSFLRKFLDTLPVINKVFRHVAITWTNIGGLLDVIVDGVLQASFKDIAKDEVIPESAMLFSGGRSSIFKNYNGYLFEVNLWDHVLPVDLLYLMARYKGNDRGNLASWKGFRRSSINYFQMISKNMKPEGNT